MASVWANVTIMLLFTTALHHTAWRWIDPTTARGRLLRRWYKAKDEDEEEMAKKSCVNARGSNCYRGHTAKAASRIWVRSFVRSFGCFGLALRFALFASASKVRSRNRRRRPPADIPSVCLFVMKLWRTRWRWTCRSSATAYKLWWE